MDQNLDLDSLYDEPVTQQVTPPASTPAAVPAVAAPDAGGLDDLYGDAAPPAYYAASKKAPKSTGGFFDELKRGAVSGGLENNIAAYPAALEALDALAGGDENSWAAQQAKAARAGIDQFMKDNPQYKPTVTSMEDVHGIGDMLKFAGGATGQFIGSAAGTIAGAGVGAAAGSVIPGVGTAGGAIAGGVGSSYLSNLGSIWPEFAKEIPDRQKAAAWSVGIAIPVAALDATGEFKVLEKLFGAEAKRVLARGFAKRIAMETAKGALAEGSTEASQQMVQDAAEAFATGKDLLTKENIQSWVDNGMMGAIGGGLVGGAGGVRKDKVEDKVKADPKTGADVEEGEGDAAPIDPTAGQETGQPTPGGTGAPAPLPAKVPDKGDRAVAKAKAAGIFVADPAVPAGKTSGKVDQDQAAALAPDEDDIETEEVQPDEEAPEGETPIQKALRERAVLNGIKPVDVDVATALPQPAQKEPLGTPEAQARRKGKPATVETANTIIDELVAGVQQTPAAAPVTPAPEVAPQPQPAPEAVTQQVTPTAPVEQPPVVPPATTTAEPMPAEEAQAVPTQAPIEQTPVEAVPEAPLVPQDDAATQDDLDTLDSIFGLPEEVSRPTPVEAAGPALGASQPARQAREDLIKERVKRRRQGLLAIKTDETSAPAGARAPLTDAVGKMMTGEIGAKELAGHSSAVARDAMAAAVTEHADAIQKAGSVGEAVRTLRESIVKRAGAIAEERATADRVGEAAGTVEGLEKARQADKERVVERTGKEKSKTPEGLEKEDERSFQRAVEAEIADKGDNAPSWARKAAQAFAKRKRNVGKGAERQRVRDVATTEIEAARAERVAEREISKPRKAEVTPDQDAARRARETEELAKAAAMSPAEKEKAEVEAARAQNKELHDKHDVATRQAMKEMPITEDVVPKNERGFRVWVQRYNKDFLRRIKAVTGNVSRISATNSAAQNFVAYTQRLIKSNDPTVQNDILAARMVFETESPYQFWAYLRDSTDISSFNREVDENLDSDNAYMPASFAQSLEEYFAAQQMSEMQEVRDTADGSLFNRRSGYSAPIHDKVSLGEAMKIDGPTSSIEPSHNWLGSTNRDKATLVEGASPTMAERLRGKRRSIHKSIKDIVDDRLGKILKDMPVIYMSQDDIQGLNNIRTSGKIQGFYVEPSIQDRADGAKGMIVLDQDLKGDPSKHGYILRHEAVHALTVYAYSVNLHDAGSVLNALHAALKKGRPQLFEKGGMFYQYGTFNAKEMIAEAYTNPAFQQILAETPLPTKLAYTLRDWNAKRGLPSLWDALVAFVGKMIGTRGLGLESQNYLEAVMRATSDGFIADDSLQIDAAIRTGRQGFMDWSSEIGVRDRNGVTRGVTQDDMLPASMMMTVAEAANTIQDKADLPATSSNMRRWGNSLKTIPQLAQTARRWLGDNNPLDRVADAVRRQGPAARRLMEEGDRLGVRLMQLGKFDAKQGQALSTIMHDATTGSYDPMVSLKHANNKHIKNGAFDTHTRAQHAKAYAEFHSLSPEAQQLGRDIANFYRDFQNQYVTKGVETLIDEAANKGTLDLPPGKTRADLAKWVLDGRIDKLGTINETADDLLWQKHLGGLAKVFKELTGLRLVKGVYVPLLRRGQYAVSAVKRLDFANAAAGTTVVNGNQLIFHTEKDLKAFLAQNTLQLSRKPRSYYYDPATGKPKAKVDGGTPSWIVDFQDKHFETFESLREAQKAAADMRQSHEYKSVTDPSLKDDIYKSPQELMPQTGQAIIDKATSYITDPTIKAAMRSAMTRSILESTAGTRIQRRRLLRRNVSGYSGDLAKSMREYNMSMSNHLATLDIRPQLNSAMVEMDEAIKDAANRFTDGRALRLAELQKTMRSQLEANDNFDPSSAKSRIVNAMLTISFLKYLASPAHSIINSMQVGMVSAPYLSARHGAGRALGALTKAYYDIGLRSVLAKGAINTARAAKRLAGKEISDSSPLLPVLDNLAKQKDGVELGAMMEELQGLGLISHEAGMELDPGELGKNRFEKALGRTSAVMRAIPEAIESINRSVTAVAAYRLARADGKTVEQATRAATDAVNNTQGDYSSAVAPKLLKSRLGRLVFQFKKYPQMMGYMLSKGVYNAFKGESPQARRIARKELAYLAITHGAVAGLGGLPFMEVAKMIAMSAAGLGLSDNDWEDWENEVQGWFNSILGGTMSEAVMHGLPRLAGADLSSRMGLDSLVFFGSPKTMDNDGVKAWLFDTLTGASSGIIGTTIQGIARGDISKILPLPKFGTDAYKAYIGATEGKKTDKGRVLQDPYGVWPAILQTLGIQPAENAEAWETGGSAFHTANKAKASNRRQEAMGGWLNAKTGSDRSAAWKDIQAFNKGKTGRDRITMDDLQRTKKRRETQAKKDVLDRRKEAQLQ